MTSKQFKTIAFDGAVKYNPVFRLVLGTCPALALSTAAMNGIGMGLAVTFILMCSNLLISLLRNVIPSAVRIPAFVLIIATFVTAVRMFLEKFIPVLYSSLGVFLPLIVVNCIILGRAEAFARKEPVLNSVVDGIFTGLGFAAALIFMSIVREVLGAGKFFGMKLWDFQVAFFTSPAGAFFVYGIFIALFNVGYNFFEKKAHRKAFDFSFAEKQRQNALAEEALKAETAAALSQSEQPAAAKEDV